MSNPTNPFSWQMPTATDLVTDLPADFEVFGQAVATSMADLLGGTTGQILSKTTNADMDFTWVSANPGDITGVTAGTGISGGGTSGDVTVTNSMATAIDAKGDLIVGTGADTFSRLAAGTNTYILTADSAEATGLKWAAPAGATTFPAFRAYRSTDESLTQNVWTKLALNTEMFDTNNNFDPTTNYRFTPTVAGYYQINHMTYIYGNNTGNQMSSIYKNGSQYATRIINGGNGSQVGCATLVYLNGSSDYIELYARTTASGGGTSSAGPTDLYLDGVGIRS